MAQAVTEPAAYATSFGYSGTYWDYVREIAQERGRLNGFINLDITKDEIADILRESGFKGYRFGGSLEWIMKTLQMIQDLP